MGVRRELTKPRANPVIDLGIALFSVVIAVGAIAALPPVLAALGVAAAVLALAWAAWDGLARGSRRKDLDPQ